MANKGAVLAVAGLGLLALLIGTSGNAKAGAPRPIPPPPPPPPPPPIDPVIDIPIPPVVPVVPEVVTVMIGAGETPVTLPPKYGMTIEEFSLLNPGITFGVTHPTRDNFINAEMTPEGGGTNVPYTPTYRVDATTHLPVYRNQLNNAYVTFDAPVHDGSNNATAHAGPGVGTIFIAAGKFRFAVPWAVGQAVNVRNPALGVII